MLIATDGKSRGEESAINTGGREAQSCQRALPLAPRRPLFADTISSKHGSLSSRPCCALCEATTFISETAQKCSERHGSSQIDVAAHVVCHERALLQSSSIVYFSASYDIFAVRSLLCSQICSSGNCIRPEDCELAAFVPTFYFMGGITRGRRAGGHTH